MRKTWIVAAGVLVLAVGGGYLSLGGTPSAAQNTARHDVQSTAAPRVVALGRLEPISEVVRVNGPVGSDAARIAEVRVSEGDWVERGAIIATLDTTARLNAALAQAEATFSIRVATLARVRADLDNQERTLLATMEQQRAQRDRAVWDFERTETLQRSGLYRDTALIDKRLAVTSAERALQGAELLLERNRMRDARGLRLEEASVLAEANVAEAAVARAQADLALTLIRAPISGRVLRRMARAGEQIGQDGIAELGDTRVMMARTEVFEADLRLVQPGQTVALNTRAIEGALMGQVERIGFKVNRQSVIGDDPATSLDARVIEVMVRLLPESSARVQGLTGLQVRAVFQPGAGS